MRNEKGKIVYVLGSGFSAPLGIPIQKQILPQVFSLEVTPEESTEAVDFEITREEVKSFIQILFGDNIEEVILEDIFTILDRALTFKENFRQFSWSRLLEIRGKIISCILFAFNYLSNKSEKKTEFKKFAKLLLENAKTVSKELSVTIINLNWDNVFETFVNDLEPRMLDYGTVIFNIDEGDDTCANSIHTGRNQRLRFLKLHGSLNWLYCSNCGRLFVRACKTIALDAFYRPVKCFFCKNFQNRKKLENLPPEVTFPVHLKDRISYDGSQKLLIFKGIMSEKEKEELLALSEKGQYKKAIEAIFHKSQEEDLPRLQSLIITPTYLKDFGNLHSRQIWQSAFYELFQAKEIIFIGYSFPEADFELRYLLKKAICPESKITVVLYPEDNPDRYAPRTQEKLNLPEKRYIQFFGVPAVHFKYIGTERYLKQYIQRKR